MGGGDVKMIGALALWFPFTPLIQMLIVMSLLGGALTLIMMIEHYFHKKQGAIEIPYGVAIAIAALISIREPIFNQFL
jgi:prepilin peptidase CpaA